MSAKQKDVGSSPAHDQNFFRHVSKGSPFNFLFCKKMDVQKLPKGPFYIFRHYATYRIPKKSDFFPRAGTVEENT